MMFSFPTRALLLAGCASLFFLAAPRDARSAEKEAPIPIGKPKKTGKVDFESDILPILKANCLACHNRTTTKGDLVLETPKDIIKGGESGRAVVPRKSKESLLLQVAAHEKKPRMPPRENKVAARDLAPEELGLIRLWIDQGAKGEVRPPKPIAWQPLPPALQPIYAVALSRDGQFAACSRANQLFVYQVATGTLAAHLDDPATGKTTGQPGTAHRDMIQSLAFSPDGSTLASGAFREIKLWHRALPRKKETNALGGHLKAWDFSPDAKSLVTIDAQNQIQLIDSATGKVRKTIPPAGTAPVIAARLSPDGARLAAISADKLLHVWSLPAGESVGQGSLPAVPTALCWVSDGKEICVGGADNTVRALGWTNAASHNLASLRELKHNGPVVGLEALRGTNQCLSASADGVIRLWNTATFQVIREMNQGQPLSCVAVRADGKRAAAAGASGIGKFWDLTNGQAVAELKSDRLLQDTAAEADRVLAVVVSDVAFWRGAQQAGEADLKAQNDRLTKGREALAAADKVLAEKKEALRKADEARAAADKAVAAIDEPIKPLRDASAAAAKAQETADKLVVDLKGGQDPAALAKAVADAAVRQKEAVAAKEVFDKKMAELGPKLQPATAVATAAATAAEAAQKELKRAEGLQSNAANELQLANQAIVRANQAIADAKAEITRSEALQKTGQASLDAARKVVAEADKPILALAFSPDLSRVVMAGDRGVITAWSAESGAPLEVFPAAAQPLRGVAWKSSGQILAFTAAGTVEAWELGGEWTLERTIGSPDAASPIADRVNALGFSPDGRRLASGSGEPTRGSDIKIWNPETGSLMQEFKNIHSDTVLALEFSADGKFLVTGAADKFVRVLDLATGKQVRSFEGHTHYVMGVGWKRDGRTVASAGGDNVVKIWDVRTGERKRQIEGYAKEVTGLGFVGATDQFITAGGDGQVRLLTEGGGVVRTFPGATDHLHGVAVTPDGRVVIAGGEESVLRIWNGLNAQPISSFPPPAAAPKSSKP